MPRLIWIILILRSFIFFLLEGVVKYGAKLSDQSFKEKFDSIFPWGFHLFQLQENIFISCTFMRIQRGQSNFLSSWLWRVHIWVSRTRSSQQVFLLYLFYGLNAEFFLFIKANEFFGHFILNHSRYICGKLR